MKNHTSLAILLAFGHVLWPSQAAAQSPCPIPACPDAKRSTSCAAPDGSALQSYERCVNCAFLNTTFLPVWSRRSRDHHDWHLKASRCSSECARTAANMDRSKTPEKYLLRAVMIALTGVEQVHDGYPKPRLCAVARSALEQACNLFYCSNKGGYQRSASAELSEVEDEFRRRCPSAALSCKPASDCFGIYEEVRDAWEVYYDTASSSSSGSRISPATKTKLADWRDGIAHMEVTVQASIKNGSVEKDLPGIKLGKLVFVKQKELPAAKALLVESSAEIRRRIESGDMQEHQRRWLRLQLAGWDKRLKTLPTGNKISAYRLYLKQMKQDKAFLDAALRPHR